MQLINNNNFQSHFQLRIPEGSYFSNNGNDLPMHLYDGYPRNVEHNDLRHKTENNPRKLRGKSCCAFTGSINSPFAYQHYASDIRQPKVRL